MREVWKEPEVRALPLVRFAALLFLALVMIAGIALLDQRAAVAQSPAVATAALAQEKYGCPEDPNRPFEEGGGLCSSDWLGYLPLGIASILFVIVVDGVVLYYIYRKRQRGEQLA